MEAGPVSAHLDYVARYYKLWRCNVTLFGCWSGCSQTEHPLHLILEALLALLLVHRVWLGETLTRLATTIAAKVNMKKNILKSANNGQTLAGLRFLC